ncbi:MAG: NEW3 domain-containing protein [Candidatus Woesearchaeota archaeon]
MKPSKTLPFVSLIVIAALIAAPLIVAFEGGSFGGFDGSGFSGGSFGGTDPGSFSGGSFGGVDPSGFSGGSFGGVDPSAFSGGTSAGTDPSAFSGGTPAGTGIPGSFGDSTGSSFDGGFPGFPGGGIPGGPTPGPGPGFPSEHDAVWEDLSDVTILRGSPSGTLVQENVFDKCSDPDSDELVFAIASSSPHYNLFFIADDIRIFDLNPGFTGTEEVIVTCNGVPESFLLHVVERGAPAPSQSDEDDGDGLSIHIGAIIIPNAYDALAGDVVPVTISFKNNGDEKLENLEAAVAIPDLGVRASVGPIEDVSVGKRISKTIYVDLPEDTQPGEYPVRITIDSGSLHRVKHRYVEVIFQ